MACDREEDAFRRWFASVRRLRAAASSASASSALSTARAEAPSQRAAPPRSTSLSGVVVPPGRSLSSTSRSYTSSLYICTKPSATRVWTLGPSARARAKISSAARVTSPRSLDAGLLPTCMSECVLPLPVMP